LPHETCFNPASQFILCSSPIVDLLQILYIMYSFDGEENWKKVLGIERKGYGKCHEGI
jgi:hypothetical protein